MSSADENDNIAPCPECGHVHGQPFDFCRYPIDPEKAERDVAAGRGYVACGCSK